MDTKWRKAGAAYSAMVSCILLAEGGKGEGDVGVTLSERRGSGERKPFRQSTKQLRKSSGMVKKPNSDLSTD